MAKIPVGSDWVFNRLLDEPERLKARLLGLMHTFGGTPKVDWNTLNQYYADFIEIQRAQKVASELRLDSEIELVMSGSKYIRITTENPEK